MNSSPWILGNLSYRVRFKFAKIMDMFNLSQFVREPTHDLRGLLDVVVASGNTEPHDVVAAKTGLSDHKLVHWSLSAT